MAYIRVTQLRKDRKKNHLIVKRKILFRSIVALSGILFVLLLPVLSHPLVAHESTFLAACTLLLFSSIIIGLTIRLVKKFNLWLAGRKHALKEIRSAQDETACGKIDELMLSKKPRLKKTFLPGLESILTIFAWAFFLSLAQPFMTAILWWQGHKLMEGKAFSLEMMEKILIMMESFVYFGIIVFLILLSWSQWNDWRYGRLNRPIVGFPG